MAVSTVTNLFFFYEKALYEVKASALQQFQYFSIILNLAYNKKKLYKTLEFWSRDMLNFKFLEIGLRIVSPLHFVYDFSRKIFLLWYSINWTNFIVWLSLLLEILDIICIAIICLQDRDVINFEIYPTFLIKPFFFMTKRMSWERKELLRWNKTYF